MPTKIRVSTLAPCSRGGPNMGFPQTLYNDNDPAAAVWLRELSKSGLIAEGVVNEKSIVELLPTDVVGFGTCHFFAGIGGWPLALALAGWPANRPVWTGSCPCQPYSSAGKGKGAADPRDLWPAFFRLICKCRPPTIFGEQVATAINHEWADRLARDLGNEGYAVGFAVFGAHSVGAPHRRQRLYWVGKLADGGEQGLQGHAGDGTDRVRQVGGVPQQDRPVSAGGAPGIDWSLSLPWACRDGKTRRVPGRVADAEAIGLQREATSPGAVGWGSAEPCAQCRDGGVGDAAGGRWRERGNEAWPKSSRHDDGASADGAVSDAENTNRGGAGTENYARGRVEKVGSSCGAIQDPRHDGLEAQSGFQPLAYGIPEGMGDGGAAGLREIEIDPEAFPLAPPTKGRTMLLKGAGNAIVPQCGAFFVRAFLEAEKELAQKEKESLNAN